MNLASAVMQIPLVLGQLNPLPDNNPWYLNVLYVVLALLIPGAIGAGIGHLKNRVVGGFFLGFFLGPLGWILVLILPRKRPKTY